MPSPFPGMDPYLEGQVFRDFHREILGTIRNSLMPMLLPRYIALTEEQVYLEHVSEPILRQVTPDVAVLRDPAQREGSQTGARGTASGTAATLEPVTIPILMPERVTQSYLEIRLRETHELITVIEVLSPTNKNSRTDGYREYLLKRDQVLISPVHLVEIDLLRGGKRMPMVGVVPDGDYYVTISRASQRPAAQVWAIPLRHPLPAIPIPLSNGDSDVLLDLQACVQATYDRAYYGSFLDYRHGTVPPLNEADAEWAACLGIGSLPLSG